MLCVVVMNHAHLVSARTPKSSSFALSLVEGRRDVAVDDTVNPEIETKSAALDVHAQLVVDTMEKLTVSIITRLPEVCGHTGQVRNHLAEYFRRSAVVALEAIGGALLIAHNEVLSNYFATTRYKVSVEGEKDWIRGRDCLALPKVRRTEISKFPSSADAVVDRAKGWRVVALTLHN